MNDDVLSKIFVDRTKYEAIVGLINSAIEDEKNEFCNTSGGLLDKINKSITGMGAIGSLKKLRNRITLLYENAVANS